MKTLAISLLLAFSCLAALGQGQVQFRNYLSTAVPAIDAPVTVSPCPWDPGWPSGRPDANTPFRAALIGGPVTSTPASFFSPGNLSMMYYPANTTLTWVGFNSGTTPPFAAGYVSVGAQAARVVPGVNWGETAIVQMVVWYGNYNTWNEAWAAAVGGNPRVAPSFSNPLTLTLPPSVTSPTLTYLWGLNPINVVRIPEPGCCSLVGLALVAALGLRRFR